jgi:FkbM family methyltransferase
MMPLGPVDIRGSRYLKKLIKNGVKRLVGGFVDLSGKTAIGRYVYGQIVDSAMERIQRVSHRDVELVFAVPNAVCKFRAETFSTKEPETLEWIDGIPHGSTVWDVGANVGLYACYAAKARGCRVFAFEPSVFNLEVLARNIFLNGLTELITIIPLPLSDRLAVSKLNMTATEWGGALSTFGQGYGHDGAPMGKVFEVPTIGLSMLDAVNLLGILQPGYIKMDVDGIEHLILEGGVPILRGTTSVSIEINDDFHTQANDAARWLQAAGLSLKQKRHAEYFDSSPGPARHTFNQIWTR